MARIKGYSTEMRGESAQDADALTTPTLAPIYCTSQARVSRMFHIK